VRCRLAARISGGGALCAAGVGAVIALDLLLRRPGSSPGGVGRPSCSACCPRRGPLGSAPPRRRGRRGGAVQLYLSGVWRLSGRGRGGGAGLPRSARAVLAPGFAAGGHPLPSGGPEALADVIARPRLRWCGMRPRPWKRLAQLLRTSSPASEHRVAPPRDRRDRPRASRSPIVRIRRRSPGSRNAPRRATGAALGVAISRGDGREDVTTASIRRRHPRPLPRRSRPPPPPREVGEGEQVEQCLHRAARPDRVANAPHSRPAGEQHGRCSRSRLDRPATRR
jgi:hypothetical protein